ncbi:MAG: leucine-rich repeat domain-containing protein [Verrucomicrobiota bacterium]
MSLLAKQQLEQARLFTDLEDALRCPDEVLRLYLQSPDSSLVRLVELRNLQELNISCTDITAILPMIGGWPRLQSLALQACDLQGFPGEIAALPHLRKLTLGNNRLTAWPEELFRLEKLEHLDLSQNKLSEIPPGINKLTKLKVLSLDYNRLESIPSELGQLPLLEYLHLNSNHLRHLPDSIGNLTSLQKLVLNYNQLETLPDTICHLSRLDYLSLKGNPFRSLPAGLAGMAHIADFSIEASQRRLFMDWTYKHGSLPPRVEVAEMGFFLSPGDPLHNSLIAMIEEDELTEDSAVILSAARSAVKIETTVPDDYSVPGRSRFGGFPDLEDLRDFPETEGRSWSFLAQINLADLVPLVDFLPPSGLLVFFVESTETFRAKVRLSKAIPLD